MDLLVKQKRVRFSDPGKEKPEDFNGTGERTPTPTPPRHRLESFNKDSKEQGWYERQFSGQVSQDYDSEDIGFKTAVAAAAFAIHALEEAELAIQKKMREELETSGTMIKSRKDDSTTGLPSSGRATRRFSIMGLENAVSLNKSMGQKEAQERAFPTRFPSRSSSVRPSGDGYRNLVGSSSPHHDAETKADAWEKAKTEKIKKRSEKMNSSIRAWENEKKMQAKLKMEKRKGELEQRRALTVQHYQSKIARIDLIAGGARVQAEEKRRSEENEVKEKAKKIRSTGKVPVKCFCFCCH